MRARLVCAGVLPEKPKSLNTYRIYSLNDEPSQKFARGLFKNCKKKNNKYGTTRYKSVTSQSITIPRLSQQKVTQLELTLRDTSFSLVIITVNYCSL